MLRAERSGRRPAGPWGAGAGWRLGAPAPRSYRLTEPDGAASAIVRVTRRARGEHQRRRWWPGGTGRRSGIDGSTAAVSASTSTVRHACGSPVVSSACTCWTAARSGRARRRHTGDRARRGGCAPSTRSCDRRCPVRSSPSGGQRSTGRGRRADPGDRGDEDGTHAAGATAGIVALQVERRVRRSARRGGRRRDGRDRIGTEGGGDDVTRTDRPARPVLRGVRLEIVYVHSPAGRSPRRTTSCSRR